MTARRRRLLALSLVVLVTLAGCAGSGGNNNADNAANTVADGGSKSNGDSAATGSQRSALVVQQRALIRTGNVTLNVENFDRSSRNLTETARAQGGFVSDSNRRVHRRGNETWTAGRVVFRIPKGNFSAFFERAKQEGEVEESSTGTQDVTDQLVDLDARLTNLRSQREKLRELYQNANDTEAVLAVQKRLSEVQSEIERLEARQQSLQKRVAYSTVTVTMQEPRPDATTRTGDEKSWYDTGVLAAFLDSVDGALVMLRAIVVGAVYVLPYLVVLGIPVGGAFALWRRWSGRTSVPTVPSASERIPSGEHETDGTEADETSEPGDDEHDE
ncbi:DUF4349 domain-containing protein [Haladaptatus halobius]|uniref:DUF4349 domain-containing protein n=1 Tax=Haladaptatus halobius TaxID=2884875 RepID=UPI001D0A8427|nr:DUF4349 domain-containing protein [Haladaptatus halobius]